MFEILVVAEDMDANRAMCAFLNTCAYRSTGCLNAADAYDAIYETLFDLIVFDTRMSGINGYQFVKAVHCLNEHTPILFIADHDIKPKGYRIGVDAYMEIPIDLDELSLRVAASLRRSRRRSEVNRATRW